MSLLSGVDISASGLTAQRLRMNTISNNIANVNTTRTEDGGPYRRKMPVFAAKMNEELSRRQRMSDKPGTGVKVTGIRESDEPPKMMYKPEHPDANEDGYVAKPNIDVVSEMTDMISATRSYEANVTALNSAKEMAKSALNIG